MLWAMTPSRRHCVSFHTFLAAGALCIGALTSSLAHAKPPAKDGKSVPADCKEHRVKGLAITACLKDADLTVSWKQGPKEPLKRTINPEGTFDGRVVVDAATPRHIGFSYDDSECTVALIVDRASGAVLHDTGCVNSTSCMVKELPKGDACTARLACVDSADDLKERPVEICKAKVPAKP